MTIQEFHINFDIELDKTLDFEYPYIRPEQKDYWLNKAQDRFIKDRLYPKDPNKKGFEGNQKRIDDLKGLVKKSGAVTPTVSGTIYTSSLPNDYKHLIRHRCTTNTTACGSKEVGGQEVQQDDLNVLLRSPFWKPTADEPLYYLDSTGLVYETDGSFTITSTVFTYIKDPVQMKYGTIYTSPTTDVQCELDPAVHAEILDIVISIVLENIESQRYQTNLNELNKSE